MEKGGEGDMLCALAAARPDLRRHALWMALAALPFFFAAPLICALAALGGREAALAVETSSALAGRGGAVRVVFSRTRARRGFRGAWRALLWALWGVTRCLLLVVALWVSSWIAALLLEAIGCSFAPRAAWAGFANAAFLGGAAALAAAASGSAFLAAALCAPVVRPRRLRPPAARSDAVCPRAWPAREQTLSLPCGAGVHGAGRFHPPARGQFAANLNKIRHP